MSDPYDLARFLAAQEDIYPTALAEIRRRQKRSHWMWFVFPQLAGLGASPTAQHFAIRSLDEARAYLAHPVLGARYRKCVAALPSLPPIIAEAVFGQIDALKLRSSLTLFAQATDDPLIATTLKRWFGTPDERTLELLGIGGDEEGEL